jgi:hypothetical protein
LTRSALELNGVATIRSPFNSEVSEADDGCGPIDALGRQLVDKGLAALDEAVDLVVHASGGVDDENQVCTRPSRVLADLHSHDPWLSGNRHLGARWSGHYLGHA